MHDINRRAFRTQGTMLAAERQVRIAKLDGNQLVLATDRPSLFACSLKAAPNR
jgi:hypothetical protein